MTKEQLKIEAREDLWDRFIEELEPFNVSPIVMNRLCTYFREQADRAFTAGGESGELRKLEWVKLILSYKHVDEVKRLVDAALTLPLPDEDKTISE